MSRNVTPTVLAAAVALTVGLSGPTVAQTADPRPPAGVTMSVTAPFEWAWSVVTAPIQWVDTSTTAMMADESSLLRQGVDAVRLSWDYVTYYFGVLFDAVTPPTPLNMARNMGEGRESEFVQFLGYAGYKLKEIESGVGLPPDVSLKFARVRELTGSDHDFIERQLNRWRKRDAGLVSEAQRRVVESLVVLNGGTTFAVETVKISVLPFPQIKFTMTPADEGGPDETVMLMRAIQRLENKVSVGQQQASVR